MSKPSSKRKHTETAEAKYEEPIIPMCKVSTDVIKKLQTEPYPQLNLATHSTISEALDLYYNEYYRLYHQNQTLNDELATILQDRNQLADEYNQIKKKKMKSFDDNIRRRRRYASEIERNYHCPVHKCNKGYGSEGSLTHHVRLKHPKFFESGDYEIYLETYILPKQEATKQENGVCIRAPIVIEELADDTVNKQQVKADDGEQSKQNQSKAKNEEHDGLDKDQIDDQNLKKTHHMGLEDSVNQFLSMPKSIIEESRQSGSVVGMSKSSASVVEKGERKSNNLDPASKASQRAPEGQNSS